MAASWYMVFTPPPSLPTLAAQHPAAFLTSVLAIHRGRFATVTTGYCLAYRTPQIGVFPDTIFQAFPFLSHAIFHLIHLPRSLAPPAPPQNPIACGPVPGKSHGRTPLAPRSLCNQLLPNRREHPMRPQTAVPQLRGWHASGLRSFGTGLRLAACCYTENIFSRCLSSLLDLIDTTRSPIEARDAPPTLSRMVRIVAAS